MRSLGDLAVWSYRRRTLVLVATGVLVVGALAAARRIHVDTDVTALLPDSFESVRNVDELRSRYGGIGYVAVVASGAPTEDLRRFADALGERLASLSSIRSVDVRRPDGFLQAHALYFVEREDLAAVAGQLEARHEWEIARRSPFYIALDDDPAPAIDLGAIEERYAAVANATGRAHETHYLSERGDTIVVLAQPTRLASDLAFAQRVVGEVQGAVDALRAEGLAPPRVELTGRYAKRVELQRVLERDLSVATGLALFLVAGYLLLHFRRVGALFLLIAPLVVGLSWTYGVAGLVFGSLNVLTAFLASILVGIGIDTGIHLLDGVGEGRRRRLSDVDAVRDAYTRIGAGTIAAAATTVVAFLAVATAELRAFREFGALAAVGLTCAVLAYATVLPALLSLGRAGASARSAPVVERASRMLDGARARPWARGVATMAVVLTLASGFGVARLRFDWDFAHLEDAGLRSYVLDHEVNTLLGRSQTPLVVLGRERGDAAAAAEAIRARSAALGEASGVARVLTLVELVPADQEAKRRIFDRIERLAARVDLASLDGPAGERIEAWRPLLGAAPFGARDLPRSLRHAFDPSGDGRGEIALVFPSVSQSDGLAAVRLARELRDLPLPGGRTISAAGEGMVLADVVERTRADARDIALVVLVGVMLTLALALGGVARAFLAGAPAFATLAGTLALLPALGLELDYMNILVLPILVGMGVDGGVHIVSRWIAGASVAEVLRGTGRSIVGAVLTSGAGFGVLVLADHPGLASVGALAALGFAVNLVVTLVFLPAVLVLVPRPGGAIGLPGTFAFVATLGGTGWARVAPGTLGALFAIPIALLTSEWGWLARAALLAAITLAAIVAADRYAARVGTEDPQEVVVDELVGALIALVVVPAQAPWMIAAFVLFRFFDIVKPGPIAVVQRRVHGGLGIVGDDVAAGLAAALVLVLARWAVGA